MKKRLLALALLSATTGVMAQSLILTPYAGIEAGYDTVQNRAQANANSLVAQLGGSAAVTQNTSMYDGRIFGGLKVIENIDLELGYALTSNVTSNAAGVTRGAVAYTAQANSYYNGLDYSVLLRPSVSSGFNNLFLRVGGTYLTQNNSVSASTAYSSASTWNNVSGSGYIVGLGYDVPLDKTFDFRAAYNYLGNIAGISNNYTNRFSIGILGKF
jgi:hypothetical protein